MWTACGTDLANRQNRSTLVLEWEVVEKKADWLDLTAIGKERVLETCPRMLIPNQVDCCLSSVSRSSLEV